MSVPREAHAYSQVSRDRTIHSQEDVSPVAPLETIADTDLGSVELMNPGPPQAPQANADNQQLDGSPISVPLTGSEIDLENVDSADSARLSIATGDSIAGRSSLITFSLLLGRCIQAQTCYYPDRTVEPSHIVCNASAQVSLCCQYGAMCLTSGLCFSNWDTSINTGTCTDITGTDHSCFQQCPLSLGIDHGFHTLYRCNDNKWCCSTGGNTTSCCNDGGVELFPLKFGDAVMGGTGFVAGFTMAPVDLSQTSTSTVAPTALATHIAMEPGPTTHQSEAVASSTAAAETPPTESTASASDATKTGLGAGLGVGVPLLAGLILALFFLRRLRSQNNSQRTESEKKTTGAEPDGDIIARHVRHEMESLPSEMPNSRLEMTQELGV